MAAPDKCPCGREILRGCNRGRLPRRCTICRRLSPPPYEDHNRQSTAVIGPDGWPEGGGVSIAPPPEIADRREPESFPSPIQNMRPN